MASDPISVQPTKRALDGLEADLPALGTPLSEIDDPVIAVAQSTPEQRDAGGAERVVSLTDRVWLKVKTSDRRAVVTELRAGEVPDAAPASTGAWWIGASGRRQSDSPHRDLYAALKRECTSGKTAGNEADSHQAWR